MTSTLGGHVEVRPLDSEDRDWADAAVADHFGSSRLVSRGRLHHTAELPCLAAYSQGDPVGSLHYRLDDAGDLEIVSLVAVKPRCGIGSALLEAVTGHARAAGCRRMWLVTTNDNTTAQRFYLSRGWSRVAVHAGAVRRARELKPEIPLVGENGLPIDDEIEFEFALRG